MKTTNSILSLATRIIVAFLCVMVMGLTSCGTDDDIHHITGGNGNGNGGENPTPTPEDKVKEVFLSDNSLKTIVWSAENATIIQTRSANLDARNRDAYVHAKSTFNFEASTEWTPSGKITHTDPVSYTSDNYVNVFGKNLVRYFNDISVVKGAPDVKTASVSQGMAYTWTWSGGLAVTLVTTQESSRSTITVDGKTFTLDQNQIESLEFKSINVYRNDRDSADCTGYAAKVTATAKLAIGKENTECEFFFLIPTLWEKKGNIPPVTDPEVADYDVRNNTFGNGATSGKIVIIYSDGSEKDYASFNIALNNSVTVPADNTLAVSSLAWTVGNTTFRDLYQNGSSRNVQITSECYVNVAASASSITNSTDKSSKEFIGNTEVPTVILPNGKKVKLAHGQYSFIDQNISESDISETSVTLNHKVKATFTGASSETLTSKTTLTLSTTPGGDDELSFTIIRRYIQNGYLKLEVSVNYSQSGTKTEYESLYLNPSLTADERKETTVRAYSLSNPSLNVTDESNFSEQNGKFTGKETTYSVPMVFPGFNADGIAKLRDKITYTRKSGSTKIDLTPTVFQNGVSLGTNDLGDEQYYMYNDNISLALAADGTEVANATQQALYKEKKAEQPGYDSYFVVGSRTIDKINGVWTSTVKGQIYNTKTGLRDTTDVATYPEAGVTLGSIVDQIVASNIVSAPNISNDGAVGTSFRTEKNKQYTISKQSKKAVYPTGFTHNNIVVTNVAATTVIAGTTVEFLPTQIAVEYVNHTQSGPNQVGSFNVYPTILNYRHGMNNGSRDIFENASSNVNLKVEKPIEPIILPKEMGRLVKGAVTVTFKGDATDAHMNLSIVGTGATYIFHSRHDGGTAPTFHFDKADGKLFAGSMTYTGTPSATISDINGWSPADLQMRDRKDHRQGWNYIAVTNDGKAFPITTTHVTTQNLHNPILSENFVYNETTGILRVTYGNQVWDFQVER